MKNTRGGKKTNKSKTHNTEVMEKRKDDKNIRHMKNCGAWKENTYSIYKKKCAKQRLTVAGRGWGDNLKVTYSTFLVYVLMKP